MTASMHGLLARAAAGDRAAEAQLIREENSGLIWSVARRYYGRGAEPDDLYQLACVGFIKAVRGFDPALGNAFSTYAVPKIAGEIRRFLRDDGAVKVSRAVKERAVRLRRVQSEWEGANGRPPTVCRAGGGGRTDARGGRGLRTGCGDGRFVRAGVVRRRAAGRSGGRRGHGGARLPVSVAEGGRPHAARARAAGDRAALCARSDPAAGRADHWRVAGAGLAHRKARRSGCCGKN